MGWTKSGARFAGAIALAVVATIACSNRPRPTILHIKNESAVTLESVVLSGSGFRVSTPAIAAGASIDVPIFSPRGESGLAVSFTAQGRDVSTTEQGYFEGGGNYEGEVVIKSDLSVSVVFRLAV